MSTYVCSDIHGQYELFLKMLETIQFSDKDRLYILGDLIDRGPQNMELVMDVMKRKNVTSILGNHEFMMISHLKGNSLYDYWTYGGNGGSVTKEQYEKLSKKEQRAVVRYIKNMFLQIEVNVKGTCFLLSHSFFIANMGTVKWKEIADEKDVSCCVWYSPWRFWECVAPDLYKNDGRTHVIGHVPVQAIRTEDWPDENVPKMPCAFVDKQYNLINIDLCCSRYSADDDIPGKCLCCMNLEKYVDGEECFTYVGVKNG